MQGIQFLANERGETTTVQIDLRLYGELWEDFYDAFLAKPHEMLESVKARLIRQGKLLA